MRLLADRAAYLPHLETLLVADVHLGKSEEFRASRIPLPTGETQTDLARLDRLLDEIGATRLLVLGDLFHGRAATSPPMLEALRQWRGRRAGLRIDLVPGNHDRHTRDWPMELEIHRLSPDYVERPFRFRHYPPAEDEEADPEGMFLLAGHLHPAVRLRADGGPTLVLPCFHRTPRGLTLPAFGSFTGCAKIKPRPEDQIYVLVDSNLVEVPAALCR